MVTAAMDWLLNVLPVATSGCQAPNETTSPLLPLGWQVTSLTHLSLQRNWIPTCLALQLIYCGSI